jgi:hypothetical protein
MSGRSLDTDLLIFRSLFAIDSNTNLPVPSQYILSTDGQGGLTWQDTFTNIKNVSPSMGYLPSTINSFSNSITILQTLVSTSALPGAVTGPLIFSTVDGLGSIGYVSTSAIQSTIQGLGNLGYVSTSGVQQIVTNSMNNLLQIFGASTNIGLGNLGYLSTSQLASTVSGLSNIGFVTNPSLASTIASLGTVGYLSSLSLQSTFTSVRNIVRYAQQSTITGLGSYGYVSSLSLQSTTASLLRIVQVNAAGSLVINSGANVYVTNLGNISYTSNFYNSSITYRGTNGITTASTTSNDFFFSTAQLQLELFSNYINSNSQITADIYPNFIFCAGFPRNVANTVTMPMSTFLSYQGIPLLTTTNNSLLVMNSFTDGMSNFFQAPIRMRFSGSQLAASPSNYLEEYVLHHRIPNAFATGLTPGLANSNIQIYMASTNSVFLTIQNTLV